jgi:hypothetical protein
MAFTGNEDQEITLEEGGALTQAYRDASPANATRGHYFAKGIISSILDQADCVGVRIYYGLDEDGKKQLVAVGVKANEDDMTTGIIADKTQLCPPFCGAGNVLNGQ